jgi:hypothetical protein
MRITRLRVGGVGPFAEPLELTFPSGNRPDRADTIIFTGQNGAGKSTLLSGVAACFGSPGEFFRRERSDAVDVAVEVEAAGVERCTLSVMKDFPLDMQPPDDPFRLDSRLHITDSSFQLKLLASSGIINVRQEVQRPTVESVERSTALVFAYGPMRSISDTGSLAISDPIDSPLLGAADFGTQPDSRAFAQWVANTKTKQALAAQDGDVVGAAGYERALSQIELALSELFELSVEFRVIREPLNVVSVIGGEVVPLATMSDGMRSTVSWLGDLLMRLDRLPKPTGVVGADLPFVLLLDEVEVHLHPEWQRRVLPMVERLFPNAQIFVSTHSPFVIGSASDATVVLLKPGGTAELVTESQIGKSFPAIAEEIMGVSSEFDIETEQLMNDFEALKADVLRGDRGFDELETTAQVIGSRGEELESTMRFQLERVRRQTAA